MQPGDLLLVHGTDPLARACQWAQRRVARYAVADCWRWNHVAVSIGSGWLIEATTRGVHRTLLSAYAGADTRWVPLSVRPEPRVQVVHWLLGELRDAYNFLDLLQLGAWLGLGWRLALSERRTWTCAELAVEALRRLGFAWRAPPGLALPAEIAYRFRRVLNPAEPVEVCP